MGQNVEVNVNGKTSSGVVEYVDFSDTSGAAVSIDGQMYPLSSVTKVYPQDTKAESDNTNFFKTAAASIANNLNSITNAIFNYENGSNTEGSTSESTAGSENSNSNNNIE